MARNRNVNFTCATLANRPTTDAARSSRYAISAHLPPRWPAAIRNLLEATDEILMAPDPAMAARLDGWTAKNQAHGAAINRIAHKLNEAKPRGAPLPYSAENDATLRAMAQEVDTALAGLEATRLGP